MYIISLRSKSMFNISEKHSHLSFTSKEGLLKEQFVWNVCLLVGE